MLSLRRQSAPESEPGKRTSPRFRPVFFPLFCHKHLPVLRAGRTLFRKPAFCHIICLFSGDIGHRDRSPALEPPQKTTELDLFTTIPQNAIRICLSFLHAQGGQEGSLLRVLSFRLVCKAWRDAVLVTTSFPHTHLVVPRGALGHCTPAFLAGTMRAFKKPAQATLLNLRIGRGTEPGISGRKGRKAACYPGPLAISSIAGSPELNGVAVTLRMSRSAAKRVPLAHLASSLSALLAAGKIVSLSLGTEGDRCSYNELLEIVRVFQGGSGASQEVSAASAIEASADTQTQNQIERAHGIDDPTLSGCRARVRSLHITENPVLLGQKRGASLFATLLSMLPNLERLVFDHSCTSANAYKLLAPTIARMSRLTSFTLDGCVLDPGLHTPFPWAIIPLPPTLATLSLRRISVGPAYFSQLLAGINALESITSCVLSGALMGMPDLACVSGIVSLVNKPTVRCLDLSCNTLFTNRYTPDRQFMSDLLASETLHSLTISCVCTPPHVITALINALPATKLMHLEISKGVYSTVISELAVDLLRVTAPASCTLEVGPHVTSWY